MSHSVARLRNPRVFAALALAAVVVCAMALPAFAAEGGGAAAEEGGHSPTIDEIGTSNEVSNQHKPEPAEAPPFMRFFYVPLIIVGFLVVAVLLAMYLAWQPRFAEERRSKRRR